MPLDKLKKSIELKSAENNSTPDLISGKGEEVKKTSASVPNARAELPEVPGELMPAVDKLRSIYKLEPAVRKIVKRAAALADLITEQDLEDDARVIREAANATVMAYDPHLRKHVERPDHKTRLAATTLRRAYHEGLPVKREISIQANFESGESVIERLKNSPEAMRLLGPVIEGQIEAVTSDNSNSR